MSELKEYWSQRYVDDRTGWDLGAPSTPLITYFEQLRDKSIHILIPGAGNSYEAEYLFKNGYFNVDILDISDKPLIQISNRIQISLPHKSSKMISLLSKGSMI